MKNEAHSNFVSLSFYQKSSERVYIVIISHNITIICIQVACVKLHEDRNHWTNPPLLILHLIYMLLIANCCLKPFWFMLCLLSFCEVYDQGT